MESLTLADQVVETWRMNGEATLRLLEAVPLAGLALQAGLRLPQDVALRELWYRW